MKILLATSKGIPAGGGIASYNQELVRLLGKDNNIYLLTDADENDVEGYKKTFRTYGNRNLDFEYCKRLADNINSANYDCIINSNSSFIPVLAPFLKANIISISHFVNGRHAINAGYNAQYQSAVIALSNYGKEFIIKKFGIKDPEKIKVIYNFVEKKTGQVSADKIHQQPLKIVYPGGTSIEKSVDVIQNLVYRLLKSDLQFQFYWLGGTTLPSAKFSILRLHNIPDLFHDDSRLKITGKIPRTEAIRIMESANIFLLPSRGEGCPMTLLEAMRGGCIPIVSDAKHGSREIIEDSRCGFICRQNSADELFKTISLIINEHTKYTDIYDKTIEYLNTALSQELWNERMLKILEDSQHHRKECISMTQAAFTKSSNQFLRYYKIDRFKQIIRSAWYRVKIDISYLNSHIRLN